MAKAHSAGIKIPKPDFTLLNKSKHLHVMFSSADKKALDNLAIRRGVRAAELLRTAVKEYMEKREAAKGEGGWRQLVPPNKYDRVSCIVNVSPLEKTVIDAFMVSHEIRLSELFREVLADAILGEKD